MGMGVGVAWGGGGGVGGRAQRNSWRELQAE